MNDHTALDEPLRPQRRSDSQSIARREKRNLRRAILAGLLLASATSANAALQCYDEEGNTATWRVGASPDVFSGLGTVTRCIAWDNELAYIEKNFTGLRMRKGTPIGEPGPIVVYVGDDAEFIVENL